MEKKVYEGRGFDKDYKKFMKFINNVFGLSSSRKGFVSFLPKLYKKDYHPCSNNIVIMEDGEFCAAVGIFNMQFKILDEMLSVAGIGNVAVGSEYRNRGYMRKAMLLALDDIKSNHADLSVLGGQRQRYGYYSYEPCGTTVRFTVNQSNIKHTFKDDEKSNLTVKKLSAEDVDILEKINILFTSSDVSCKREEKKLFDTLITSKRIPFAVFEDVNFIGYFVISPDMTNVAEFKAVSDIYIPRLLLSVFEHTKGTSISFDFPRYDLKYVNYFDSLAEHSSFSINGNYTVFNFENVLRAYLKLAAKSKPLCDGKMNVLIHGYNGDELLEISVFFNTVSVIKTTSAPDVELTHREAMQSFFAFTSESRSKFPPHVEQWFPLPLYCYACDDV